MLKRTLVVLPLILILICAVSQRQVVHAELMTPSEVAVLDREETASSKEERDNSFVRVLKSPFRAIGRLFGKGKSNKTKLERLTEKDIKQFKITPADPIRTGNPDSGEGHNLRGMAYEQKGLRNEALSSFELAVKANPNNPEYANNLGYLLFKNGEYERATKYLKRAAKLAPDNARIWNNLGLAQCEIGRFDDAYKSFARAHDEFKGHLNIALRLESLGHTSEAIKHLEQAVALQPRSEDVLARLLALYESTGRRVEAQRAHSLLVTLRNADAGK